jgi:hypothetical protein
LTHGPRASAREIAVERYLLTTTAALLDGALGTLDGISECLYNGTHAR